MKVKTLIEKLEKMDPEAEIRLHDKVGEPVLFVLSAKNIPDVWLQSERDVDMAEEIQSRFDDAIENGTDELDVYIARRNGLMRALFLTVVAQTITSICTKVQVSNIFMGAVQIINDSIESLYLVDTQRIRFILLLIAWITECTSFQIR